MFTVEGINFIISGTLELNFSYTGTVNGSQQCVNVTIVDDIIFRGQLEIELQVEMGIPEGQIDFSPNTTTIVIEDNDGRPPQQIQ